MPQHRGRSRTNRDRPAAQPQEQQPRTAEPLIVPPRVAEQMLSVSHRKLYELLDAGELESLKVGRARRIRTSSIRAFIERGVAAV